MHFEQDYLKAICLTGTDGITPAWFKSDSGTVINIIDPGKGYPHVCFNIKLSL